MSDLSKEQILNDLIAIITNLTVDWDFDGEVTGETQLVNGLGFGSVDVVALASAIERYCRRSLPFAEFLTELNKEGYEDLSIEQLADFIYEYLKANPL